MLQLVVLKVKPKGEGQQSGELQLCKRATELFHLLCKQRVRVFPPRTFLWQVPFCLNMLSEYLCYSEQFHVMKLKLNVHFLLPIKQFLVVISLKKCALKLSKWVGLQQTKVNNILHLCLQNLVDHIHTREEMLEVTQTLLQMAYTGENETPLILYD